jgi:YgiT-type zinc finger domain-containing protein
VESLDCLACGGKTEEKVLRFESEIDGDRRAYDAPAFKCPACGGLYKVKEMKRE